jgi:hypothetical protein
MKVLKLCCIFLLPFCLLACQSTAERATGSSSSQLKIRNVQTKNYIDVSKKQALRAVIATLQDLEFIITDADYILGSVTATKLTHNGIKISIIVQEQGNDVSVRANARQNKFPITQKNVYHNFFLILSKSIFLVKNSVN